MTGLLTTYASQLHLVDESEGMIARVRTEFPEAYCESVDIEMALRRLARRGAAFDVVGSFWSMSYPLLECFEDTTACGVRHVGDLETGIRRAGRVLDDLLDVLAPGGHLLMLFFDANSAEQRLVTRLWEQHALFPGTGRDFTWNLLIGALRSAENAGRGRLRHRRCTGFALADNEFAARRWFLLGHLNGMPELVDDPRICAEVREFVAAHRRSDGKVALPSAVHVVHYENDANLDACPADPGLEY